MYLKKIHIDHGDKPAVIEICNISANIASFFTSNEHRSPYKCTQLNLCSDPHGKEKPLSSPSREAVDSDVQHHGIPAIWEKEQGHF